LALPLIQTTGTFEDTPNNKMRKIIASRLTQSKREVPHFYTSQQVQLDSIMNLRKKLANEHDVKVSVNDFVLRCCALALRDVPEVNGTIDPSTQQLRLLSAIDISVAVATPTGLITPIVFGADRLCLSEIAETVKDLATRARMGKLAPHEYQGGSFSVSNLGMFGVDEFSAVINPPQAAILAVGGGSRRFVPTPFVDAGSVVPSSTKKPVVQTRMTARLSADRRVVDEATAGLFLSAFSCYANEPELMLL
jgi:pyruvate dehydrogenase E2 component (dihydrolipoamide acetyltransferase)